MVRNELLNEIFVKYLQCAPISEGNKYTPICGIARKDNKRRHSGVGFVWPMELQRSLLFLSRWQDLAVEFDHVL